MKMSSEKNKQMGFIVVSSQELCRLVLKNATEDGGLLGSDTLRQAGLLELEINRLLKMIGGANG